MREEVCCSSSRSRGVRHTGTVCRGRSSGSVGFEKARYVRECPACAHHRSVGLRAGRVYGCGVWARGTESYRRRYNLEAHGKRVGKSVNRRIIIS